MSHGGLNALGHHVHPRTVHFFKETNLVSDISGRAQFTDPKLVNPWGLTHGPTTPWWVSDNGSGVSTLYNADGSKVPINGTGFVTIPSPTSLTGGTPTGIVFNASTTDFLVNGPGTAAHFIFATEDGTIAAWSSGISAVIKKDNSGSGAVYKGLATGSISTANFLYATNFHAGTIDVFDSSFNQVTLGTGAVSGKFTDPHIPRGFAPFGIQNVDGNLFVTYAKQDAAKHDDVAGRGLGLVEKFDTSGNLIRRVATGGSLNAPWGVAVAPSTFGHFANDLLIGDFGDGRINAYKQLGNGGFQFVGQLNGAHRPVTIPGLWGLAVGNDGAAGPSTTLFFTAGPNNEKHGLFGTLTPATATTK